MAINDPGNLKIKDSERKKPEFHLGKEALEGFDPAVKPDVNTAGSETEQAGSDYKLHPIINKTLKASYPEVADDDEEELLADVRRHWLGRYSIIVTGGFVVIVMITIAITIFSV